MADEIKKNEQANNPPETKKIPPVKMTKEVLGVVKSALHEKGISFKKIKFTSSVIGQSPHIKGLLETGNEKFFIKYNTHAIYKGALEVEARGLNTIGETKAVKTPEIISTKTEGDIHILLMEYIDSIKVGEKFQAKFGSVLAQMHKSTNNYFGLDYNNVTAIGLQINTANKNWVDFFLTNRIMPFYKRACDNKLIDEPLKEKLEILFKKLPKLIPKGVKPSLLHGDFHPQNWMVDSKKNIYLIDPAIYYGDREVDIAHSVKAKGFNEFFYNSYNEAFPLKEGWQQRTIIYNIRFLIWTLMPNSKYNPFIIAAITGALKKLGI